MILGVGLGSPIADEFGSFGETTDTKELAAGWTRASRRCTCCGRGSR